MPNRKLISKLSIYVLQDVSTQLNLCKTNEPLEPLPRCTPRGFRTAFDQLIVTWTIGAVGESTQQKWLHPRQFDPPESPKALLYFLHPNQIQKGWLKHCIVVYVASLHAASCHELAN